jgi:transcriptional regulator with XRE-family HTH domain
MSDLASTASTASAGSADGVKIPVWAWEREEIRDALRARDAGAILRFAQQYGGASQSRIAAATGLLQGRVNEIVRGRRSVVRIDVFERIARGLRMPDDARMLMGLAPAGPAASADAEDLLGHPRVAAVSKTKPEAVTEIQAIAETAESADVLAVRALGTVAMADSLLRGPLTRPGRGSTPKLRVMVLHPESPAVAFMADKVGETERFFAASLRFGEELLHELADQGTVDLEVYRYLSQPVWRIVRLDGTVFVAIIGPRSEARAQSVYRLAPTPPGSVAYGFHRQFEATLETAARSI